MRIVTLVGTRPNFVKMAPVVKLLQQQDGVTTLLIHTGQHFDREMSDLFFEQLDLPLPDFNLAVGALSPWQQTAAIIGGLGEILTQFRPDWVIVPGDVNSTLAGAIAAIRAEAKLAHLEAGLRSFDRTMPEELNRVATDHLADLLFVTETSGYENLTNEGILTERIRFVGNTMIDTLLQSRELSRRSQIHERLGLSPGEPYIVLTAHRPALVDEAEGLRRLLAIVRAASYRATIVFPVHPRTKARIEELGFAPDFEEVAALHTTVPLGYLDFLALLDRASLVLTDSGGIQEETTVLGTPCLTLRDNTERPVTCTHGTNRVVGTDPRQVEAALSDVWQKPLTTTVPERWDGHAAERVVTHLLGADGAGMEEHRA